MNDHERATLDLATLLWLQELPGLGPVTAHKLINQFDGPLALFHGAPSTRFPGMPPRAARSLAIAPSDLAPYEARANALYEKCDAAEIKIVTAWSSHYPGALREPRTYGPVVLFVAGDVTHLSLPLGIAIVGTRHPTAEASSAARRAGISVASAGEIVVSGLAAGIDTAGHSGALAGGGATIAVLGRGVDRAYPATNAPLYEQIVNGHGAVVSEYSPGTPLSPERLRRRNRLIVALARCVVVAECPITSGAMIAARAAVQQSRPLAVLDLQEAGHDEERSGTTLLREGQLAVAWAGDAVSELDAAIRSHRKPAEKELDTAMKMARAGGQA